MERLNEEIHNTYPSYNEYESVEKYATQTVNKIQIEGGGSSQKIKKKRKKKKKKAKKFKKKKKKIEMKMEMDDMVTPPYSSQPHNKR